MMVQEVIWECTRLTKARDQFYWPGLRKGVEDWCQQCTECAQSKTPTPLARSPLSPSVIGYSMERIALDLRGLLPVTQHGNKYIFVVSTSHDGWKHIHCLIRRLTP